MLLLVFIGSEIVRLTTVSEGNFTYLGLHFVFVHTVSKTPVQKSQRHRASEGASARRLTWHTSLRHRPSPSRPLWIVICAELRSIEATDHPPLLHPEDPHITTGGEFLRSISRVTRSEVSVLLRTFIKRI